MRGGTGVGLVAAVALAVLVSLVLGLHARGGTRSAVEPERALATPSERAPAPDRTTSRQRVALLLPNMRSLGAHDFQIQGTGPDRLLRFAASLANLGPGPLLLQPRGRKSCRPGRHSADQLIHRDRDRDGRFDRGRDRRTMARRAGCMLDHPTHDHWHFDAMAAYSLRRPGQSGALVGRPKVSFCLRDNHTVPGAPRVVRREWFGECTADGPQGISPGWVDVYTAELDGQTLRVPARVDGRVLCLDVVADPRGRLREANELDNGTSVAIRIDGTRVIRLPPRPCR